MKSEALPYGFQWGSAEVMRCMSDDAKGWVYLDIRTPKELQRVSVYVTKTGKTRVYKNGVELT